MLKIVSELNQIFTKKQKIQLIFLFFFAIILSAIETIGIGSLVGFVLMLQDPYEYIQKIPFKNLELFLSSLDKTTIAIYSSVGLIVFFITKNFIVFLFYFCEAKINKNITVDFSKNAFRIILNKSYKFHTDNNPATFINTILNVVNRSIQYIFNSLLLFREFITLILLFILLIVVSPQLSIIVFTTLVITSYIFYFSFKKKIKLIGSKTIEADKKVFKYLNEAFSSIKLIKLFEKDQFWVRKFFSNKNRLQYYQSINYLVGRVPKIFLELIAVISIVGVFLYFIINGKTIEEAIPILTLITLVIIRSIPGFVNINISINAINFGNQSIKELIKILLENKTSLAEKNKHILNKQEKMILNSIELKNISYSHDKKNITLNNISIKMVKGDIIGVTGITGSGKTTLVDIILGLLKPQSGEILINNKKIQSNFKIKTGYVTQDTYLTDDSISENIAFSNFVDDIDFKKIQTSIRKANLENFIENLPRKLDTLVGEGGVRISGGQKQRIGLARALYEDPDLLVLDEATSALDYQTEDEIINNIFKFKDNKITLVIAHRLSSLKLCNKVINLENGTIKLV